MATQPAELMALTPADRRQSDISTQMLVQEVLTMLHSMDAKLTAQDVKLSTHIADETAQFELFFNQSFPDGDAGGHKMWHEATIRKIEARAKFWETMKTELAKWGLIGFCGFAAVALWKSFIEGPK